MKEGELLEVVTEAQIERLRDRILPTTGQGFGSRQMRKTSVPWLAIASLLVACSDPIEVDPLPLDDARLAFGAILEENPLEGTIYLTGREGQGTRMLAIGGRPAWSPDGFRLAYESIRINEAGQEDIEVFVINRDGSGRSVITGELPATGEGPYIDWHADWSPDGSWIAFVSNRGDPDNDIYLVRPDGSDLRRLTSTPEPELYPDWSPDSQRLVFQRNDVDGSHLEMITVDGNETRLTSLQGRDQEPAWSPDGSMITFTRFLFPVTGDIRRELFLLDVDSGEVRRILTGFRGLSEPAWAPDGTTILFVGTAGERHGIWEVHADGTNLRMIRGEPGSYTTVAVR